MLSSYKNLLLNPAYLVQWLGTGPWTLSQYTAPGWKFERVSTPTASVRLRNLDATLSTDKKLRGQPCIHIDIGAIDPATQSLSIKQRVSDSRRLSEGNLRLTVPVYGPTGATFSAWFTRGGVNLGPTYTTQGVGGGTVVTGTAQSGGASTITLAAGASSADDAYNEKWVEIVGGTGLGQMRLVSDYVGATKVLTVDLAWEVQPDNTSLYKIATSPLVTWVNIDEITSSISQEYTSVQTFGNPSQTGTFMIGPADFQLIQVGGDYPLQFCERGVEEIRLWERYYPVKSGLVGRSSTTSFFPFISFPVSMREIPTYTPLVTSDVALLNDTAGTLVPSTLAITNAATDITVDGARVALQSGWVGLTNGGDYQIKTPKVVGVFVADY